MCKTLILSSFICRQLLRDLASAAFGLSWHSDIQRRGQLAQKGPPALQVVELVSQVPQPIWIKCTVPPQKGTLGDQRKGVHISVRPKTVLRPSYGRAHSPCVHVLWAGEGGCGWQIQQCRGKGADMLAVSADPLAWARSQHCSREYPPGAQGYWGPTPSCPVASSASTRLKLFWGSRELFWAAPSSVKAERKCSRTSPLPVTREGRACEWEPVGAVVIPQSYSSFAEGTSTYLDF